MQRLKKLNGFQKILMVLMAAMVLVSTILYPVTMSQKGYLYKGELLKYRQEGENAVYTGSVYGTQTRFIVTADKAVTFQYGPVSYGPYTMREDPTAVPKNEMSPRPLTGVELLLGDEVIFRGGMTDFEGRVLAYGQEGGQEDSAEDDIGIDDYGYQNSVEPTTATILKLMRDPALTHKGAWWGWVAGVFCCVVTAISILFADELFRAQVSLQIRNVENIQPSDWEIFGRYATWIIFFFMALLAFFMGLQ